MTGSNCRHPACKAGALPAELMSEAIEDAMRSSKLDNSEFLANITDLHEVKI